MRSMLLVLVVVACALPATVRAAPRPWPSTNGTIGVFSDQLRDGLTPAQVRFVATHMAGSQKLTRSMARLLRAVNPNFLVLHYRLGEALGYRSADAACRPTGAWLAIIRGDRWVREWPARINDRWFYHWHGQRVYSCTSGNVLADPASPSWRAYWTREVLAALGANADDGVFMDSLSVPNEFGADTFKPGLPAFEPSWEHAWSRRIDAWLRFLKHGPIGRRAWLVPNVGSWITTRDRTTYAAADGVMVEGFATAGDASPYAEADWQLQLDRALRMIGSSRAVIAQSYVATPRAQLFVLGSYLLIHGQHTYLNLSTGFGPQWWPAYDVSLGTAMTALPQRVGVLYDSAVGVFRRRFQRGEVLVNPSTMTRSVVLPVGARVVTFNGGGNLGPDGRPTGTLAYQPAGSVRLGPATAAIIIAP